MKTLAQLQDEAQLQDDALEKPRLFLAIFPAGPFNGKFLDPFLGVMEIRGLKGVIWTKDVEAHNIQAVWADGKE